MNYYDEPKDYYVQDDADDRLFVKRNGRLISNLLL